MRRFESMAGRAIRSCGLAALAGLIGLAAQVGCYHDETPPPTLGGPPVYGGPQTVRDPVKPLPDPRRGELPPPPYADVPLVTQEIPEARQFVEAYRAVGQPRIAVFVNRSLDGDVIPVNNAHAAAEPFAAPRPAYGNSDPRSDPNLQPGQYTEVQARSIDYAAIEAKLADWLSCGGAVHIASSATIRERLTDDELRRMQQGRPRVLNDVARNLNCDILVQVQARPTRETDAGLEIRLIAEAIDIPHGEALGHAVIPVRPPLITENINASTRFVARKLMTDMMGAWSTPATGPAAPGQPPTGQPAPGETRPLAPPPPTGPGTAPPPPPSPTVPGADRTDAAPPPPPADRPAPPPPEIPGRGPELPPGGAAPAPVPAPAPTDAAPAPAPPPTPSQPQP